MLAVYVSNGESGSLGVLRLDAERGALQPLQTVSPGGDLKPMAASPDGRRLYVADRAAPRFRVLSFAIDAGGRLDLLGEAPLPHSMAYLATDRSGRWLLSASYPGHLVAVSAIAADGIAGEAVQVLPTGPNAHAIEADAGNRTVLATSLGSDTLASYDFDAATGQLALRSQHRSAAGAGPRHFRFSADQRFVYLLNELDGTVDVQRYADGTLQTLQSISQLPPGFAGAPWAADLHLSPDGRFLYASERRGSTLAGFRVDAASGLLEPIGHWSAPAQPRGFAISPCGRWLLCSGEREDQLRVYEIDAASGTLTPRGSAPVGRGANWVLIVSLKNR